MKRYEVHEGVNEFKHQGHLGHQGYIDHHGSISLSKFIFDVQLSNGFHHEKN